MIEGTRALVGAAKDGNGASTGILFQVAPSSALCYHHFLSSINPSFIGSYDWFRSD